LPGAVITGWLPRQAVVARLREARALVLPSVCDETFGRTVLEAAALGIPAIVPDSCAARELVEHMVTGLWFRGSDVDDLQRKMEILMDAKSAAALGKVYTTGNFQSIPQSGMLMSCLPSARWS
jgi:glycosyltransferase involved in cell wall biosynthesis